jgi:hypothetical protein
MKSFITFAGGHMKIRIDTFQSQLDRRNDGTFDPGSIVPLRDCRKAPFIKRKLIAVENYLDTVMAYSDDKKYIAVWKEGDIVPASFVTLYYWYKVSECTQVRFIMNIQHIHVLPFANCYKVDSTGKIIDIIPVWALNDERNAS